MKQECNNWKHEFTPRSQLLKISLASWMVLPTATQTHWSRMHCTAGIIIIPWLMMILHMVRMGMYFCVDSNFQDVGMMVQFVEI
jgi:hypothetical protein